RSNRIGRFTGLCDQNRNCVRTNNWIAVTPLARIIHFYRNTCQTFDHELASQTRVPAGTASRDVDFLAGFKFSFGNFHLIEENVTGVLRDASQCRVTHGARLLINFFEHEMLEATLFRHDRVPGHMLHLAHDWLSVEVGELYSLLGNHSKVAIA